MTIFEARQSETRGKTATFDFWYSYASGPQIALLLALGGGENHKFTILIREDKNDSIGLQLSCATLQGHVRVEDRFELLRENLNGAAAFSFEQTLNPWKITVYRGSMFRRPGNLDLLLDIEDA
jgi:hypothetical protein